MLAELGRLKLLIHAWQRIEQIAAPLQSEIRQMIGWNIGQDELEGRTDGVDDVWAIVGQTQSEEKQLRVQRSWLLGRNTGAWALVVQFAAGTQPFAESLLVGTEQAGTMIYYPGASQQRARWIRKDAVISQVTGRLPGAGQIDEFLSDVSTQLAAQPWLRSSCGLFHDVTLTPGEGDWLLRDNAGYGWHACRYRPSGGGTVVTHGLTRARGTTEINALTLPNRCLTIVMEIRCALGHEGARRWAADENMGSRSRGSGRWA